MVVEVTKSSITNIDEFFHQIELDTMEICHEFEFNSFTIGSYVNESSDDTADDNENETDSKPKSSKNLKLKETIDHFVKSIIQKINEVFNTISGKIAELIASATEKMLEKKRNRIAPLGIKDDENYNLSGEQRGGSALSHIVSTKIDQYFDDQEHIMYRELTKGDFEADDENVIGGKAKSVSEYMKDFECSGEDSKDIKNLMKSAIHMYLTSLKSISSKKYLRTLKEYRDEAINSIKQYANTYISDSKHFQDYYVSNRTRYIMNKYTAGCRCYLENLKSMLRIASNVVAFTDNIR